jgi:anti-sigma factor RsiW
MDVDGSEGCIIQAPLSDRALIAALDKEADEEILEHLRICPSCSGRVQQLRRLQQALRARLYRLLCPSSEVLVDYHLGLLGWEQRKYVAHHIAQCPHCVRELDLLARCNDTFEPTRQKPGSDYTARLAIEPLL